MQGKSRGVVLGGSADTKIGIDIASPVTNGPPCSTRAYISSLNLVLQNRASMEIFCLPKKGAIAPPPPVARALQTDFCCHRI